MAGMARHEQAGGARDPAELPAAQGVGRRFGVGTGLDLDEGQQVAAPGHDVDLAELWLVAPREDGLAGQAQPPDRAPFGGVTQAMRSLPGRDGHDEASRFSSSARA